MLHLCKKSEKKYWVSHTEMILEDLYAMQGSNNTKAYCTSANNTITQMYNGIKAQKLQAIWDIY